MEDPARTATSLLAAAPPLALEAAGLRQGSANFGLILGNKPPDFYGDHG
jgi:hypothetical protein